MPAMWNSWAPRWRPWPSQAGPGMRKRTRRCRACLPPNPQLFLISSTNTCLLLLQLQLAVKQQSARLEEKQLIRLYHLRLFWKHAWISEPVRQWNRRTRPEFDVPVISKLIGLNPKCKNVTQWYWGPIQMCSLWSVICICDRTHRWSVGTIKASGVGKKRKCPERSSQDTDQSELQ